MSIIQEHIVHNGHGALNPQYFCVHSTAVPGAPAQNFAAVWSRGYPYAVHLVSDWEKAYHCVPYNRLCWQVGNGNYTCEGLEICEATNDRDFKRGIEIAAQVVRERLQAHGWGVDRLRNHRWFSQNYGGSDHTDPYPYFQKFGYTWEQFVQLVANGGEVKISGSTATAEGEDYMPLKNDPISYGGMNVTGEYALQDLKHCADSLSQKLDAIAKRLGPISDKYPFDYLPALLNNQTTIVGKLEKITGAATGGGAQLSDEQVAAIADKLKSELSADVVKLLAEKLSK